MTKRISLSAVACGIAALSLQAANVKRPEGPAPRWSGAEPLQWTMDYKSALAQAKAEGRWTLMLYTGSWWCPWCQPLEEKVFVSDAWKDYAAGHGFYEVEMDFPNRAGTGYFCWLWDSSYQSDNGLTPETAAAAIVERLHVQDSYSVAGGTARNARNMVVGIDWETSTTNAWYAYEAEPTTSYTGIGYPSILVIAPSGEVVGRFSPDVRDYPEKGIVWTPEQAFASVTNDIERILALKAYVSVGVDEGCEGRGSVAAVEKLCDAGETITLKAQPNKGFGFAGWFVGDSPAPTSLDYRMSPNTIEVFGDTAVVARFVSVAEDTLEFDLSLALESFVPGEAVEVPLSELVDSGTFPTLTVSGLPTGLKFDAKSLTISGAAKKTGVYTVKASGTNASGYKYSGEYTCTVEAVSGERLAGLDQTGVVGEPFYADIGDVFDADACESGIELKSLSVSGLPSGVKLSSDKKSVSGVPSKTGTFVVTGKATYSDGGSETATLFFDVSPAENLADDYVSFEQLAGLSAGDVVERGDIVIGYSADGLGVSKVSGLPKGLSLDVWTDSDGITNWYGVVGVPTAAGSSKVSAKVVYVNEAGARKTASLSESVLVGAGRSVYISASVLDQDSAGKCSVSGGGVIAAGAFANLTAKAASGFVFAGWCDADGKPVASDGVVDYRSPTRSVQAVEGVQGEWYAMFVAKEEDSEIFVEDLDGMSFDLDVNESLDVVFSVTSYSLPTIVAKGLPKGASCTAVCDEDGCYHITYDPLSAKKVPDPGRYTVKVSATNVSKARDEAECQIIVSNWTNANISIEGDYGAYKPGVDLVVDADVNPVIFLTNAVDFVRGDTLSVSGLPKGMKYNEKADAKKGIAAHTITGRPTVPGEYTLYFTAKVLGEVCKATSFLTVEDFPELSVEVDGGDGCKVTGLSSDGKYICGSKVALKAVAAKDYVFAGWGDGVFGLGYMQLLNPALSYVTTEDPVTIRADFVHISEDSLYVLSEEELAQTNLLFWTKGANLGTAADSNLVARAVDTVSLPSVSVSGLPQGVKFSSADLSLSGAPKASGYYYVTVSAKNAGGYAFTRVWRVCVLESEGAEPPEDVPYDDSVAEIDALDGIVTGEWYEDGDLVMTLPPSETGSSVVKAAVSGAPAGLEHSFSVDEDGYGFLSFFGTPTKAGLAKVKVTVTYDDKKTAKASKEVVVEDGGSFYLDVYSSSLDKGSVTGSGVYPAGGVVKVSATAKKGCVFAGWWHPERGDVSASPMDMLNVCDGVDYRTAKARFLLRPSMIGYPSVEGLFVNSSEDAVVSVEAQGDIWEIMPDTDSSFGVDVGSMSLPTVKVKGLPKGIAWNASEGLFTYSASSANKLEPGVHEVAVSASNKSNASGSTSFLVVVPNVESYAIGGLDPDPFAYVLNVGATVDPSTLVPEVEDGWKLSVSGLPSGLSWKNGALSGWPKRAGYYTVTFTATGIEGGARVTEKATVVLCVDSLPESATGSFSGVLSDGEDVRATVSVAVASDGAISAKVVRPSGATSFSAPAWDSYDADKGLAEASLSAKGLALHVSVDTFAEWTNAVMDVVLEDVSAGGSGIVGACAAPRNSFVDDEDAAEMLSGHVGVYWYQAVAQGEGKWALLPKESSPEDVKVSVSSSGTATIAGKVGGYSLSGSVPVVYDNGELAVRFVKFNAKTTVSDMTVVLGGDGSLEVSAVEPD